MKSWILIANASVAYLYDSENLRTQKLRLLEEKKHPESREKGSDLISDRPGHYQTDHMTRSAYEKSDPKAVEAEVFARELAAILYKGFNTHQYEQLVVVAPPHFYGLLHKDLNFKVDNFIHISKDYTKLSMQELPGQLSKQIFK